MNATATSQTNPPPRRVLVTGAAGFIGSHIVRELLARGWHVVGSVRDPAAAARVRHLTALPDAGERLQLVAADLLVEGAFDAPAAGCDAVVHSASPYQLDVGDAQRDLVDPALNGTANVLAACARSGTVKRVVVTSSMAAVTDQPDANHTLTEADWNTRSSLTRNPYYYSKTLAERAAWSFMEESRRDFDLVAINPFLVIGPSLSPGLNTSNQVFVDLLGGVYPGIMSLTWGMVDVRDVALAHALALEVPAAHGRNLCVAGGVSMREVVDLLRANGYGDRKLPKLGLDNTLGDYAVRLLSYLQPRGVGSYLRTHVGRVPRVDNGKIRRVLGLTFRDLPTSILDTVADLERWGHLAPRA